MLLQLQEKLHGVKFILKAFKVQLMGGIALHNGDIAEMKTGEGKTLASIFPVYLNALTGKEFMLLLLMTIWLNVMLEIMVKY